MAVTSFDPLVIYLHEEGLARLASEPYCRDPASFAERCAHLTNYSVNKKNVKQRSEDAKDTQSRSRREDTQIYGSMDGSVDGVGEGESEGVGDDSDEDGVDLGEEGEASLEAGSDEDERERDEHRIKLSLEELKARLRALRIDTGMSYVE